jgi:hypothetical protein
VHPQDKEISKGKHVLAFHEELLANSIDVPIIGALERLNDTPGVATVYSCAGHNDDEDGYRPPYVILVLSKTKAAYLREGLWEFCKQAPMFCTVEFRNRVNNEGTGIEERIWIHGEYRDHERDKGPEFLDYIAETLEVANEYGV